MRTFISYFDANKLIERNRGTLSWEINKDNLQVARFFRGMIDYKLVFEAGRVELFSNNMVA